MLKVYTYSNYYLSKCYQSYRQDKLNIKSGKYLSLIALIDSENFTTGHCILLKCNVPYTKVAHTCSQSTVYMGVNIHQGHISSTVLVTLEYLDE